MIELPPSFKNNHLPLTDNRQHGFVAVEPYIPMPISEEQVRFILGGDNTQLYLENNEVRNRRQNRQLGIVLREPSVNQNQNIHDHGRGKRPLEQSDLNKTRKNKKI